MILWHGPLSWGRRGHFFVAVLWAAVGAAYFPALAVPPSHRPLGGGVSPGCKSCHGGIENATQNMGFEVDCAICHGGDSYAFDKASAHVHPTLPVIMDTTVPPLDYDLPYQKFVNPSNLRVASETCGACHLNRVDVVKKGMMATTAGHYAGGLYQNGVVDTKTPIYATFKTQDLDGDVPTEYGAVEVLLDLISYDPNGDPSLVATHYRAVPGQACARCHLWSRGKGYRGAVGQEGVYRADGCAACHMLYKNHGFSRSADASIDHTERGHPAVHVITKAIPTSQCLHCHHRGARIGLSFTGRAQMPPRLPSGLGVPGTTDERFNGNYHVVDPASNPPDIHHERGMHCIDCHTKSEVMGDGNIYGHMDQATKIECRTCHGTPSKPGPLFDRDGNALWNVSSKPGGDVQLTSKVTGATHPVRQVMDVVDPASGVFNRRAACAMNGHHLKDVGGLECAACHAAWTPNCFGCHFQRDERLTGLNMVTRQYEVGKASTNNKVFESLKHFFLGPNAQGRISPYIVGCQPIADVTAPDGSKILDFVMPETVNGLSGLAIDPVNPHTIRGRGEVRTCVECHRSPPSLGLGSGHYTVARDLALTATTCGVAVFDRHADPVHPPPLGVVPTGAPALGMATIADVVQGTTKFLFVACGAGGVSVFDFRSEIPAAPAASIGGINAVDVSLAARYLYTVIAGVGVGIYDVVDPISPTLVATIPIPNAVRAVPWGIHLFVPAGTDGLVVVDVSDHHAPQIVGTVADVNAVDVTLYAHFQDGPAFAARAYVADPDAGVYVLDLLPDFSTPWPVELIPLPGATGLDTYTRYLPTDGIIPSREHDYLYVAAGAAGLHVFDMTVPDEVVEVASLTTLGGAAVDVDVASQLAPPGVDDYALIANATLGLQIVDVTDPLAPVLVGESGGCGASRAFVEVQPLDRFINEQGEPLKENSHPGTGVLSRADIVRILSAPVIEPGCAMPDLDGDIDADLHDHVRFVSCLTGPGVAPTTPCGYADLNGDGSVDLQDFARFQAGFGPR